MRPRILALHSREGALDEQFLKLAIAGAKQAGAEVTSVYLADYDLPLYDCGWDVGLGMPAAASQLQGLVVEHHALLIATREHNAGCVTLLKNAIDWICQRNAEFDDAAPILLGKLAALVPCFAEPTKDWRAEISLAITLIELGVLVLPRSFAFSGGRRSEPTVSVSALQPSEVAAHIGATLAEAVARLEPATFFARD